MHGYSACVICTSQSSCNQGEFCHSEAAFSQNVARKFAVIIILNLLKVLGFFVFCFLFF